MVLAQLSLFYILLVTACKASLEVTNAGDESCPADDPEGCQVSKGSIALQTARSASQVSLESKTVTKHLAGVKVNIHGVSDVTAGDLPKKHTWVITLPENCTDAQVEEFSQRMPTGARTVFSGTPSSSGLCIFVMEGTELELEEELKSHPGAVLAEMDMKAERDFAETALIGEQENKDTPTDFPLYEGFPQVSTDLFPQRKMPELAEVETEAGKQYGVKLEQAAVPNWGGNCGGPWRESVYLPVGFPGKAPLVVFSHGFGQGGARVEQWLGPRFLRELAKKGFVVVAHQTGLNAWCNTGYDQLKSLQWAKTSKYANKIDFSKVSFWGYSMGAFFSSHRTANKNEMDAMNVKTTALLMGPCQYGCGKPEIPAFWGAGGADTSCPANQIKRAYNYMNTGQAKVYKLVPGAPHTEVGAGGHNRFLVPAIQHMRCHFYNSGPNCDAVYNSQNPHYKP